VPSHSFKFAAALQAAQACHKPVVIGSRRRVARLRPTDKRIAELADQWGFTAAQMGLAVSH
jgi:prolyl oligopeptidase